MEKNRNKEIYEANLYTYRNNNINNNKNNNKNNKNEINFSKINNTNSNISNINLNTSENEQFSYKDSNKPEGNNIII